MLSGKVPFQSRSNPGPSAMAIMKSIMDGKVNFDGDEWLAVSESAKDLIQGTFLIEHLVVWSASV